MIKVNKFRALLVLIALILIAGWFYWFEFRPAKIRQECSWVKHTTEAIPAKPAMTEEELKANGLIKNDCKTSGYVGIFSLPSQENCSFKNNQIIEEYKTARAAVPAKDWYSKASDKDFDFCIRENGLIR